MYEYLTIFVNFCQYTEQLWLPLLRITIIADEVKLGTIIQAFQNLSYIGELRQRWEEIKKLQSGQKRAFS